MWSRKLYERMNLQCFTNLCHDHPTALSSNQHNGCLKNIIVYFDPEPRVKNQALCMHFKVDKSYIQSMYIP